MGNDCTTCTDSFNMNKNETEYSADMKLPVSFLEDHHEDEDENKEILINAFKFLKDLDDGKDSPGEIHVPKPDPGNIMQIKAFPLVLKDMFISIEAKFGFFNKKDSSARPDNYKVEAAGPMEILVKKKEKRVKKKTEISLHPLSQTNRGVVDVEFKHMTSIAVPDRRKGREVSVYDLGNIKNMAKGSELHEYYEGEWRKLKYHGYGKLITVQGHAYEGHFANGLPHGKGRIYYNNGDFFDGFFEKGKVSGRGQVYTSNGAFIKGEFVGGLIEGKVYESYPDGSTFEGSYANGKRNGPGVLTLTTRDRVKGNFHDNFLEGEAEIDYKNGDHFKGEYQGNRKSGKGRFTYKDGRAYEGLYDLDRRWGQGKLILKNGGVVEGKWYNGVLHGETLYRDPNGKKFDLLIESGKVVDKKGTDVPDYLKF